MLVIDLSKPYMIEAESFRFYLGLYKQILVARAAGINVKENPVAAVPEKRLQSLMMLDADWGSDDGNWLIRDNMAIINCRGPIVRYGNLMDSLSSGPMASLGSMARDYTQAMNDDRVEVILWNFDTPGGAPPSELAERIFNNRDVKPSIGYIDNQCCSAGIYIASACNETVIDRLGIAGSIGAVMTLMDDKKYMEMRGLEEMEIVSSVSPFKRPDAFAGGKEGKQGREQYQALVDDCGRIFAEDVARYKGVSFETVVNNFGQGWVFTGQGAVDAGLVDRVGDFESIIASYSKKKKRKMGDASASANGGTNMGFMETIENALIEAGWKAPKESPDAKSEVVPEPENAAEPLTFVPQDQLQERDAEIARLTEQINALQKADGDDLIARRETEINAFMEMALTKTVPAAETSVRAMAEQAYENGTFTHLTKMFDDMAVHASLAEVPAEKLGNTQVVPPVEGKGLAEAAVSGAKKNYARPAEATTAFGDKNGAE